MIHLIYGQPLHLVEHPNTLRHPKRKRDVTAMSESSHPSISGRLAGGRQPGNARTPSASLPGAVLSQAPSRPEPGSSNLNGAKPVLPRTSGVLPSNGVTGSSKRALSPIPAADPVQKKKRVGGVELSECVICGRSPHHLVKDCPLVAEGPKRYDRTAL